MNSNVSYFVDPGVENVEKAHAFSELKFENYTYFYKYY